MSPLPPPPPLLQVHCDLFLPFCERGTPQLTLLIKMQEFCYDHMNFMKVFHKIVLLLYQGRPFPSLHSMLFLCLSLDDVLTEQAILKWYSDAHVTKGKSVFLPQMKRMVDWLLTAEEESDAGSVVCTTSSSHPLPSLLFVEEEAPSQATGGE